MPSRKKKILIADPSPDLHSEIALSPLAKEYEIISVDNGPDCLKKVHQFQPDLILMELLLPEMHAIEILKEIKKEDLPPIGVIITSYEIMMQNYQASIDWGANYFLNKPFKVEEFFSLVEKYFSGDLMPEPFQGIPPKSSPMVETLQMLYRDRPFIKFWGTRGSIAVSGPEFIRYGGCTSCLEIRTKEHLVIIDAGTGIIPLANQIDFESIKVIDLFISHTHLDHIIGFPFFDPLYVPGMKINVWAPVSFEKDTKSIFTDMMAYAFFPVRLEEMKGDITFKDLRDQSHIDIGDICISCCYTYHPGPTLGFKIDYGGKKIGYITDNEIFIGHTGKPENISLHSDLLKPHLELYEFLMGVDILIHEAQYFDEEYEGKIGWGHSSIGNASILATLLQVPQWYVTHHDPKHTDEILQIKFEMHKNILLELGSPCSLLHAKDGLVIPL